MTKETKLALERLSESGLEKAEFDALRLNANDAVATLKLSEKFHALPSITIPYFDPFRYPKRAPLSTHPTHSPFFRVRYLGSGGEILLQTSKPPRYAQPPGTGVCAYFPANLEDWPDVLRDPTRSLLITEGEFKAAKACREGFPTIGLGGVYSFRSAGWGVTFLPELAKLAWPRRRVYIVYDSDYRTNPRVCQALVDLARELARRGALPFVVSLPELGTTGKTGLDDFLVKETEGALENLIEQAEPLALAEPLWRLNEQVIFVRNPGLVVDLKTGQKISPNVFREATHSTANYAERVFRKDGSIALRMVPAAKAWLSWPLRNEAAGITYAPGKGRLVETNDGVLFNTWSGWGIDPKPGNVKPFLALVEHLFSGAEKKAREWFLRWCAYPLQFPGTKMFTSVCLFGTTHGTGKTLLGYTLGAIYGKNFCEISRNDLHSSFNEWAEGKQLVLGDDVTGSDRRADADMLKKMITQTAVRINQKFVPTYVVPDRLNFFFTSNQPDAFFLEDTDRRFFIHEIVVDPLEEDFYQGYDLWLAAGGAAHVFDYLLKLDLGNYNPNAPALKTKAKERMTACVRSDLGEWVERLRVEPADVLRVGSRTLRGDLFTNSQLLSLYDPQGTTKVTANGLGRELRRQGLRQVHDGRIIKTRHGLIGRFYAVRNADLWLHAALDELVKHIDLAQEEEC